MMQAAQHEHALAVQLIYITQNRVSLMAQAGILTKRLQPSLVTCMHLVTYVLPEPWPSIGRSQLTTH